MRTLQIKVIQVKGYCPVYSPGDQFVILEGYKLRAEKMVCMHSLASILPYYVALSRGVSPKELGLGDSATAYVQCLDPCEYTGGGTAVFAIAGGDL